MNSPIGSKRKPELFAICLAIILGFSLAGTGTVAAQEGIDMTVNVPQNATVGEQTTLSTSVTLPDLIGGSYESSLSVTFYSNGQKIGSENVSLSDGETTEVELNHTFESAGEKEIKVNGDVTLGGQEYGESIITTLNITELEETTTVTGAAFAVPESLEDEVADYRETAPQEFNTQAFVLATHNELYLVFTQQEPTTGVASVEGSVLKSELTAGNLTYGVITSNSTSFETQGANASVQEVSNNSDQYQLDLVRINAHYRRVSTLTDPDKGENFTLSVTSGALIEDPQTSPTLFQNIGRNGRLLSQNASIGQVDSILNNPRAPHLQTFSFETGFWTDGEATVDAIVLDPQSVARQFIDKYDHTGIAQSEGGEPILYVIKEDFQPQQFENVGEITSQSDSLDGEVVETEVNLYHEKVSVQETLEHNTGCSIDLLEVQTSQGPVCINVVQDNLLYGGIAWNDISQTGDDTLLITGVSSRHQDTPEKFEEGRYHIEGEIVSTSRLNESLPEKSVLVIYDMERVDDIDYEAIEQEARSLIETRTQELATILRKQVGEEGVEIVTGTMSESIQTATPDEPATVTFSRTGTGPVSVQEARINVSSEVQNLQVNVSTVASLPGDMDKPPGSSIQLLGISSSAEGSDITNASFQIRVATAAIPERSNVTVSRYHDGEWTSLDTTIVEETNTELVLNVKTTGFSHFAVSTVTDQESPSIVGETPAKDLNGDGTLEDVNGDGTFDIVDVSAFFQNYQSETVESNPDLFDFNNDGTVDIVDVSALFGKAA